MSPEERRPEPFLEHLSESEKRLGAKRYSVFDAFFMVVIAVIILGGIALGVVRLRLPGAGRVAPPAPARVEQPQSDQPPVAPTQPAAAESPRPSAPRATAPAKDDRPYIDASKPGKYTIKDSKVEVEINTLSGKERNEKIEQFKKEGLLTPQEAEALKSQQR